MSDSEPEEDLGGAQSAEEIESCLRRVVRAALKNDEIITINLARSRAETELGLSTSFLKESPEWKQKSKEIINASIEEPESPEKPKVAAALPSRKRKSDPVNPMKKRRKKTTTDSDEHVSDPSDRAASPEFEPPSTPELSQLSVDNKPPQAQSEPSSKPDSVEPGKGEAPAAKSNGGPDVDSESELSSLIDEPPPKKKRQKKSQPAEPTGKSKPQTSKTAKTASTGKELSADEEEIKRLQGWLQKCGIRKLWHRELASHSTSKEKIRHLKKMLEEVGMTGRYSAEKAKQIKEARELAAEIEAAKEFNEHWGDGGEEDDDGEDDDEQEEAEDTSKGGTTTRPKRTLPKGLVDFGDSGDESD